MADIDLFMCVTGHTSDYAEFTKRVSSKLLSGKHNVRWKYIISGKVDRLTDGYEYVATSEYVKNRSNHGHALNLAAKKAEANYVIMLDTDCVLLYKNWDDVIVKNLDSGYSAFGLGSADGLSRAYNFPFIYCFCYKRSLLNGAILNFKVRLDGLDVLLEKVNDDYMKKVTGLPLGSFYIWETSSRLPFIFYDNNLKSKALDCLLGNFKNVKLPFVDSKSRKKYLALLKKSKGIKGKKEYMEEWQYNGELFATHLRGSYRRDFKTNYVQNWIKRINLYLQQRGDINEV